MFYLDLSIPTTARYDLARFVDYSSGVHDILSSFFLSNISQLEMSGTYQIITEEGRPDLISFNIYGSTQYWWIIMYFNSISNFDDLSCGLVINYPSLQSIEDLYFQLNNNSLGA
jgi:hypothetical protein